MTDLARFHEKLVIVSHVVHYRSAGRLYAYAPYAREIELWADMFDSVLLAAPCRDQEPPGDAALLDRPNFEIAPQREAGGETWGSKIKLGFTVPLIVWDLAKAIRQGDAVHVRCPGNLGLLGAVLGPIFSKHLVAKYAGQWSPNPNDPLSIRFQRAVLRSSWWRGPVTVYGRWPNEPAHVIPFFNTALTAQQIARAQISAARRGPREIQKVLYVGRLSRAKNVDVLLKALGTLQSENVPFTATIAGEGPELASLKQLAGGLGLRDRVEFAGGVSFERIVELLEQSGTLVLASQTEGWPKAIVEGMAFGLVAIGSNVGLVPEILGDERGLLVPPGDVDALTGILREVLTAPDQYAGMRKRAAEWASRYSMQSLRNSLHQLLAEQWGLLPKEQATDRSKESQKSDPITSVVCAHD